MELNMFLILSHWMCNDMLISANEFQNIGEFQIFILKTFNRTRFVPTFIFSIYGSHGSRDLWKRFTSNKLKFLKSSLTQQDQIRNILNRKFNELLEKFSAKIFKILIKPFKRGCDWSIIAEISSFIRRSSRKATRSTCTNVENYSRIIKSFRSSYSSFL